ncbi:hypothetical protein M432DRAFT_67065 [Thermoascus aurantiacus ATCC 26904]
MECQPDQTARLRSPRARGLILGPCQRPDGSERLHQCAAIQRLGPGSGPFQQQAAVACGVVCMYDQVCSSYSYFHVCVEQNLHVVGLMLYIVFFLLLLSTSTFYLLLLLFDGDGYLLIRYLGIYITYRLIEHGGQRKQARKHKKKEEIMTLNISRSRGCSGCQLVA